MKYYMPEKTKQFSQLWDDGVKSGVIGIIGGRVFTLLVALAPFMDKDGKCYPSENGLANILGRSVRTVAGTISRAKKIHYKGEPVLTTRQEPVRINGRMVWGNNHYTISKHILDDLLGRYCPVGKNLYTEEKWEINGKDDSPHARIPRTENVPTNDSQSVNNISYNDTKKSLINKFSLNGIPVKGFENKIDTGNKQRCYDIAVWLGEKNMNFILSALHDPQCGPNGIEWAFRMVKEDYEKDKVRNKCALFNFYIQKYKDRNTSS